MKREAYYDKLHAQNLPALKELLGRMIKGVLKIISITIDEPQFGHKRVIIFFHENDG